MRVTGSPSRLDFISLGGTIAAMPSTSGGLAPSLDGGAILQAIPGLQAFPGLRVVDGIRPRPGPHLDLTDVVELAHRARALIAAGSKGIIVSQGTDTLEEVAFGVSLLAPRGVPIVFTGAMRDSTQAGADGPANVLGAVRVAASGLTSSMGVVVVINDEIHDAVDVQKTHTTNPAAFRSPNLGPVGWTAEDRVEITSLPANHPTADVGVDVVPGDVALLTMALRQRRTADSLRPAAWVRGTGRRRLRRRARHARSGAGTHRSRPRHSRASRRAGTKRSDAPLHLRIRGL